MKSGTSQGLSFRPGIPFHTLPSIKSPREATAAAAAMPRGERESRQHDRIKEAAMIETKVRCLGLQAEEYRSYVKRVQSQDCNGGGDSSPELYIDHNKHYVMALEQPHHTRVSQRSHMQPLQRPCTAGKSVTLHERHTRVDSNLILHGVGFEVPCVG